MRLNQAGTTPSAGTGLISSRWVSDRACVDGGSVIAAASEASRTPVGEGDMHHVLGSLSEGAGLHRGRLGEVREVHPEPGLASRRASAPAAIGRYRPVVTSGYEPDHDGARYY